MGLMSNQSGGWALITQSKGIGLGGGLVATWLFLGGGSPRYPLQEGDSAHSLCRNVDPPIWYDTDVKLFEIQRV